MNSVNELDCISKEQFGAGQPWIGTENSYANI